MSRFLTFLPSLALLLFVTGCSQPYYEYHYVPGKTAALRDGYVIAPPEAPQQIQMAIAAGNRIAGLPYRYGGGHQNSLDSAYDCSGSSSFVLREAGLLHGVLLSKEFRSYGKPGEGKWINVYVRHGHVFLSVAGIRFDTGWTDAREGPQWTTRSRPADGCVVRHPANM